MVSVVSSGFEGHSFGPVAPCHVPLSSWPQCRSTDSGGCHGFSQSSKHHPVRWHQPHRGEGADSGNAAPNSSLSPGSCERNGHPPKGRNEGTGMRNRGAHLPIPASCPLEFQRDIKRSEGTETDGNACPKADSGQWAAKFLASSAHPPVLLLCGQSMEAAGDTTHPEQVRKLFRTLCRLGA